MENLISLSQSILDNPEKIINYIAMFTFLSTFFLLFKIVIITWAVYDCWKNEKDINRRNVWIAIILIGKLTGSLVYLFFEKIMKKEGGENGSAFKKPA